MTFSIDGTGIYEHLINGVTIIHLLASVFFYDQGTFYTELPSVHDVVHHCFRESLFLVNIRL